MNRFPLLMLFALLLFGCARDDFRNGYSPGDVETVENAEVYHLADGVLVVTRQGGNTCYYLIESTVADYELTAKGLDVVLEGEKAGTYSIEPAPEGYVAAWITEVEGDGPGVTRFQIENGTFEEFLKGINGSTTVRDVYRLKR